MFDVDKKVIDKMAPHLKRVLVADPQPASARLISELLRDIARSHVWAAPTDDRALKLAQTCDPQLVFVELADDKLDGLDFIRKLRRSTWSCRQAPVIALTGDECGPVRSA